MMKTVGYSRAPIAALVGLVVLAACGRATANDRDGALELAPVETRDLVISVEAAGQIEPLRLVEVKSLAGGEVMRLHVDIGDEVQQGALLAEINPRDVRNSLNQADADVAVARANEQTTQAALGRARELREASIMTVQEFESAQLQAASATANLIKARTNYDLALERMGDITIRAPIHGTVVQKQVEQGQIISSATSNVGGGTTLVMMADLSTMQVRTLVDQTDIGKVKQGQQARVSVDAYPNRSFVGTVTKIEPQATVEQNVTMFPVLIQLQNPERLLLPGMNADVEVSVDERRGVATIPNGAVTNPRNAQAAAEALGISEAAYQQALRPSGGPGAGGAGRGAGLATSAPAAGDSTAGAATAAAPTGAPGGPTAAGGTPAAAECMELFQKMRGGGGPGGLSAADRAKLEGCRTQMAATMGAGGPGGARGGGMRPGGRAGTQGDTRQGVVFVSGENGPEARMVTLGLNDLDYTEVVRGVETGEHVIVLSGIQLLQQQQQMIERMRANTSAIPSAGGGGGGGGGGARIR